MSKGWVRVHEVGMLTQRVKAVCWAMVVSGESSMVVSGLDVYSEPVGPF